MSHTISVLYDGHVLIPEEEVHLQPNRRYVIQVEIKPQKKTPSESVLKRISERAVDLGVSDLAAQHDHYLYGVNKR